MLKNKVLPEDKVDTLLAKGLIPIIDLGHAGKFEIIYSYFLQ